MTVAITYPVDALVSYHYYRDDHDMVPLVATGRLRMVGDSGAFSALTQGSVIDLDEYAAWCLRWRPHLVWVASLDVIGDPEASHRNWTYLRQHHGLEVIPTLHAGTDTRWLDVYAEQGVDFIGLGGMAGMGQATRAFRWALHMFRYARDRHPGTRFHLWGVTSRRFLDTLPAWSADSSGTIGRPYRYGSLRLFDPASGKDVSVMLRGSQVYQIAPLLRRVYGVDPNLITTSHPGNRALLAQLGAANVQQYAAWLQRRHGQVSAPRFGIAEPVLTGPRIHVLGSRGPNDDLLSTVAPRVHVVTADGDDLLSTVAPVGPRVHLVTAGGGGNIDDLTRVTEVAASPGPHLHMVDTSEDKVGRGLALRDAARSDLHPAEGGG